MTLVTFPASTVDAHWLLSILGPGRGNPQSLPEIKPYVPTSQAWDAIIEAVGMSQKSLVELVASHFRLTPANIAAADRRAQRLVTEGLARQYLVFPLRDNGRQLVVATCDPMDLAAEQTLAFASARKIVFEVSDPATLRRTIDERYGSRNFVEELLADSAEDEVVEIDVVEDENEFVDASEASAEPVIRLTNLILRDAVRQGASDIHLQPEPYGGLVRFRVDGILRPYMQLPSAAMTRVVARVKILGRLDVADRLRPQDGRARIRVEGGRYDLRISTVPARGAEKAVLRVLDQNETVHGLADVGLTAPELQAVRRILSSRDGILIVTGPTGSGKTTTLYSALRELASDSVNIMTVEDPVEYEMSGVTQIQVERKQGVTFASTLRAILRQDPDILLVGEIRDSETAEIAVKAAMTGHLVLTTLHTNDAIGTVRRLLDLGLDRPAIADTLRGVLAQRLVRCLCRHCVGGTAQGDLCPQCGGSGYRGRRPLVEVFEPDGKLRSLIVQGAPLDELEAEARRRGMRRMAAVGRDLIEDGTTDAAEISRVLGVRSDAGSTDPASVLVVDGSGSDRHLARTVLERTGWPVLEAEDGLDALRVLEQSDPVAMVVAHVDLPRMGGLELARRLRSSEAWAHVPILMTLADADAESEIAALDAGADDVLAKPLRPHQFAARVRAGLRRSAVRI